MRFYYVCFGSVGCLDGQLISFFSEAYQLNHFLATAPKRVKKSRALHVRRPQVKAETQAFTWGLLTLRSLSAFFHTLNIKPKLHNIPIIHDIILTFNP